MEQGNAWRMVSECVRVCLCVFFMARGHLLLPLPPTHSKCISVKHMLTSRGDFTHLENHCSRSVKVNGLRPHTNTHTLGTLCVCVCVYVGTLKSNMSASSKDCDLGYLPLKSKLQTCGDVLQNSCFRFV